MDHKEICNRVYEEFMDEFGRQPTDEELSMAVRDSMLDLVAAWECVYENN